jgi:hypothetical protein
MITLLKARRFVIVMTYSHRWQHPGVCAFLALQISYLSDGGCWTLKSSASGRIESILPDFRKVFIVYTNRTDTDWLR